MSQQPSRKPQHQQQSPPAVKEEQQEQEEEDTHLIAAGGINASQCSLSNFENSNNTIGSAGGNGGDDINQLKLKMAALEAKYQILEGRLEYQELNARIHAIYKKMMDEFGQRLTALEAKHQQEIAKLKAIIERNQQQIAEMRDYMVMVVNMPESQETSNNFNGIQHKPKSVAPNLVPCHSANLPDCVNIQESHGNLNTLDERLRALEGRNKQKARLAQFAALIPPPPKSDSAQQQEETKRLCNPLKNCWNSNCKATMKVTLLGAHNCSPVDWGNLIARKGFLVSDEGHKLQQDNFAGPILYYYEITATSLVMTNEGRLFIGFSSVPIKKKALIGQIPNTYAMQDEKHDYCFLSGVIRYFDWPDGVIKPILRGYGDVFGCGFVLSADNKLAIFFTVNGILMGKQIPIVYSDSILYPTVQLNRNITVEANFGQKPFRYNIDQCPGLQLQW